MSSEVELLHPTRSTGACVGTVLEQATSIANRVLTENGMGDFGTTQNHARFWKHYILFEYYFIEDPRIKSGGGATLVVRAKDLLGGMVYCSSDWLEQNEDVFYANIPEAFENYDALKVNRTYVLFPWFEEHGTHHIHPNDLMNVRESQPFGKVFLQAGEEGDYVLLEYGPDRFRALPKLVQEVELEGDAHFLVGDRVVLVEDGKEAKIRSMTWHHKRSEPIFGVEVDGKLRKKRYWSTDFHNPEQHQCS